MLSGVSRGHPCHINLLVSTGCRETACCREEDKLEVGLRANSSLGLSTGRTSGSPSFLQEDIYETESSGVICATRADWNSTVSPSSPISFEIDEVTHCTTPADGLTIILGVGDRLSILSV